MTDDRQYRALPGLDPDRRAPQAGPDTAPVKDGREWRTGTPANVAWITSRTVIGRTIDRAVPLVFDAYATVLIPEDADARVAADSALLGLLAARSPGQPWWLGYLDTGAHDVVFPHAPRVLLYARWSYVLVEAGPSQAGSWRADDPWRGRLPDLIFPADRSWLATMLWDDDWRCVGGSKALLDALGDDPALDSRTVRPGEDATPPGHVAY